MYLVINKFLLSHQSLDFRRVPEFFKLFYGFELEVKHHMNCKLLLFFALFLLPCQRLMVTCDFHPAKDKRLS